MTKKGTSKYTEEHIEFIRQNVEGRFYSELRDMFNKRFKMSLSVPTIRELVYRHGLKNNMQSETRFKKGHTPWHKGMKGLKFSDGRTCFKKGRKPYNIAPVGTEVLEVDGYTKKKIAEPDVWVHKHRIIWEEANGKIPDGYVIIFLDGNKQNMKLDNLMLVSRRQTAVMAKKGLYSKDPDVTRTGAIVADVVLKTAERKRERK